MQVAQDQRRKELYGPARILRRETVKKLQQEDNVKFNILRGACIDEYNPRDAFSTVSLESFRAHPEGSKSARSNWDPSEQNATHIKLGSEASPRHHSSVLKEDYGPKPIPQYKLHTPSDLYLANIPDMAARYQDDRRLGHSMYNADFDGDKCYGDWSSRMIKDGKKVGRRHKTTFFQKSTHFEFGSDPPSLKSEMRHSFRDQESVAGSQSSNTGVQAKSRSNVFRADDIISDSDLERERFVSVQKQDYTSTQPAAGVPTTTSVGYSHVLPRDGPPVSALSYLRQLLIVKNTKEYQNQRDPSALNVTKAFINYDINRSGCIDLNELRTACQKLGVPITEGEIRHLLAECDENSDGKLDYTEFIKYLTSYRPPQDDAMLSLNAEFYSGKTQNKDESESKCMGGEYQTSTHFHFGDSLEPSSSVYNQDFSSEEVKSSRKTLPAPPPPSSKVIPESPVTGDSVSTSRRDFVKHDMLRREKQRLAGLKENKERHSTLAVELKSGPVDKTQSVTTASFSLPPSNAKPPQPIVPDSKNYYHLESNRALLQPPVGGNLSEVRGNFTAPLSGPEEYLTNRLSSLRDRNDRISDNKGSHVVLGFDKPVSTSEKAGQYGKKFPVDPSVPAAGKPNLPTKSYSVIEHCSAPSGVEESADSSSGRLQSVLQQRNYLKNINPRDPFNVNLRKAFLEYDKNLSGCVSREEVREVCSKMELGVEETDLDTIISSCDQNGSGQIDYHDFALCLSRQHQPQGSLDTIVTTTTRKDFKHPEAQTMSAMQQHLLLHGPKPIPLELTHFFHLDNNQDNYLVSTTRKDFIKPEEH